MTRKASYLIRKHCSRYDYWCGCCKWSVIVNHKMDPVIVPTFEDALKLVNQG